MFLFQNIHSVAIVWASADPKKIGNILLAKNSNYSWNLYGINPKWGSAYGRDFYPDFASLPEVPDIAVFAIPEFLIYDALESAGKSWVKKAIIITAGFKEIGNREGESRLIAIAQKYGIRLLGPNCLGYGDTFQQLNLSFGSRFFDTGNIGIISQSGAMAVAITDILADRGLGFSSFFSLGNKSDLDETDLLLELAADPHTKVMAIYLESITRGEAFLTALRSVTATKPVILMIGGVSEKGKIATASHTGSLSGDRLMYEAAIRQGGGILTYSVEDFFDFLQIFSLSVDKNISGKPYIITNAWGIGVLSTDQCDFSGLALASISPEQDLILRKNMPEMMSTKNPIDIIGDADSIRVKQILENIIEIQKDPDIIFFFTIQATTDIENIARVIIEFRISHPEVYISVGLIGGDTIREAREILSDARIFVTETPESMIASVEKLIRWKYGKEQKSEAVREQWASHTIPNLLDQNATERLFASAWITTTETYEYETLEAVFEHSEKFSGPYILKIAGKSIAHKSDIGGVSGRVSTREEIEKAYNEIIEHVSSILWEEHKDEISGISIGKYILPSPKYELFFGAKRDPIFGPTFLIGAGGVFLSILADTEIHIGKWQSREEIWEVLDGLRSAKMLSGYRGQKSVDMELLITMIEKLSDLFLTHPEIREIDINPILFADGKAVIADAKVYV